MGVFNPELVNQSLMMLDMMDFDGKEELERKLRDMGTMQQLLALPQRPQAVFVGNDAMAVGAYQALYQAGLHIPQDMALVGYDDIELARYMTPPLTTIHQPKDELGELAIDVLIHRMADPQQKQQRVQLTPELVVRGSA